MISCWSKILPVLLVLLGSAALRAPAQDSFVEQVDLEPLSELAVHTGGRLNSLGSYANSHMQQVSGPRSIGGRSQLFTYLDMLFRPDVYEDADVIYVKNKLVRRAIIEALNRDPSAADRISNYEPRMAAFEKTGLTSAQILVDPSLREVFGRLKADLVRTNKEIVTLENATVAMKPVVLLDRLRILPPGGDSLESPWFAMNKVMLLPGQESPDQLLPQPTLSSLDPESQQALAQSWQRLYQAWNDGDVGQVNQSIAYMTRVIPEINPEVYPSSNRLSWESWYFRNHQLTRVWLIYMLSVILLLLGLVYQWKWARWSGMGVFLIALALQTFGVGLRWYISGRWPNANMYEAVTTAAWFGSAMAVVFELLVRRTAMRSIFALAAATASMFALMAAYYLPAYLNPNIENMMPVLHDIWLYIHTNVIIFSYCLIFMAAVSSALYIVNRMLGGAPSYARVGGAASIVLGRGAGAISDGTDVSEKAKHRRARLGEVLDGVTMLLMELSFVLLWAGIVMGAIWADHSWGRPWGWDPKEVFALETFIVFAVLVHVRLKVHDKGLWTAWLAVLGAAVMLFNWIVINFVISGLHSYA